MTPFLTVVTRHMQSRSGMYTRCLASLCEQTCQNFEHLLIVDPEWQGSGFAWVNAQWAARQADVHGRYVLQLGDDDMLAVPEAIAELKAMADAMDPDIIFFRTDHRELGILPDAMVWERTPVCGHVSDGELIVKRELWARCLGAYNSDRYEADYDYLLALWATQPRIMWYDKVLMRCQRISRGQGA